MSLDKFPDYLLTETLLWLPLKSVFQCKCISNRWCSLISTPYFTRRYVGHHHTNLQPFTLLFEYNELEDSCNDLLLWRKWPKDEVPGKMSVYYVMNPITSYSLVPIPYLSHKSRKFKIHMFSSNTSEWSEFEPLLPALEGFELCHFPRSAVSYKGMLFCPGTGGRLLAFDPYNARSCRLIEKPIEYESHGGTDCVRVCQGCLRICQIHCGFV
uniref:F-box domain-containing protein n=1 Tax=Quercus lobata TaxID=97700 RepID=A0A7N2LSK0_QUELO